jgi:tetratricopeptide (TPR) repeat protein
MRRTLLGLSLLALPAALRAEQANPPYEAIFEMSDAAPQDRAVQEKALARIDAEVARAPKLALNHYVRGRILSRLGRDAEALAAYDEAVGHDATLGSAHYNAGVVLARLGRKKEAGERFDRALTLDPKAADAAYNAGQSYYDLKDFAAALDRFQRAHRLAPADFDAAKKVIQANLALDREKEAWKVRDRLIALWKSSRDPAVRRLREYVLDQFEVGTTYVMAYETLAPAEDLAYLYTFKVFSRDDKPVGTVQLETSAVLREGGVAYVMGVSRGATHQTTGPAFKALPRYSAVKEAAKRLIAERLTP